jgi:serine/threonine protein kinase
VGCLAYILLTGKVLFKEDSDEATLANIKTANLNKDFLKDDGFVTIEALKFISSLLIADPSARPSLSEALANPWFRSHTLRRE